MPTASRPAEAGPSPEGWDGPYLSRRRRGFYCPDHLVPEFAEHLRSWGVPPDARPSQIPGVKFIPLSAAASPEAAERLALLWSEGRRGGEAGEAPAATPAPAFPGDERRARRVAVREDALVRCWGTGAGDFAPAAALDISEAGARLLLPAVVAPGQTLEVLLQGAAGAVLRPARVAWAESGASGLCRAGVQFEEPLSPEELAGLSRP